MIYLIEHYNFYFSKKGYTEKENTKNRNLKLTIKTTTLSTSNSKINSIKISFLLL